jgi:hypothetical protein
MKRFLMAIVLTGLVSVGTLAGNIPTGDAIPPPPPPASATGGILLTTVVLTVTDLVRP